ncbi:MAG: cob(I)yrinic acid a,c-diamide adenosyltransferase [Sedimentisphaerales bacterium]|nr:cob(I)yrinic acid a,c-diamide adenosyltransferase [Sedimentisphaerales bacterium]
MLEKGLVQIYTGDGKGKTTAAFGLALRAAGCGHKVLIYQFLKPPSLNSGERTAIKKWGIDIKIEALDCQWDMIKSPADERAVSKTRLLIKKALQELAEAAGNGEYDVIILDEIVYCVSKGLAATEDIRRLIDKKDNRVEIVMTGRGADERLKGLADLVSEIKCVKHPYDCGVKARKGIEF